VSKRVRPSQALQIRAAAEFNNQVRPARGSTSTVSPSSSSHVTLSDLLHRVAMVASLL
jgi:hypothetical protein